MKTVIAEFVPTYECDCPHCGERIYSEYQDDWDIGENYHYDIEIKCTDCENIFKVELP